MEISQIIGQVSIAPGLWGQEAMSNPHQGVWGCLGVWGQPGVGKLIGALKGRMWGITQDTMCTALDISSM